MPDSEHPASGAPASEKPRGSPSPSPRRPPGTFRIGRIAGSDVLVSSSWFLVAALIAVVMAPRVDQVQPGLGAGKYVAGFAFAVILYGSVLLHEVSHALVARRFGFPVQHITLHFLGGMTAVEGEARRPREEFLVAVVGPLTSLAVGAGSLALLLVAPGGLIGLAVEGLAFANLVIGVLNLVPGLPLDGGRLLKAGVWWISGSQYRGAIAAGWGGRVTALLVLLWPAFQAQTLGVPPELLDYVLAFVIGLFLWSGASAAMQQARVRRRLPDLVGRDLARRTLGVPEQLPLGEAVRRAREAGAGGLLTLDPDDRPVGVVNEAALLAVPEERRPWVPVSSVARSVSEGLRLPVSIAGEALVLAINREPAAEYLLVEPDGSVYGVLATADVDTAFRGTAHR